MIVKNNTLLQVTKLDLNPLGELYIPNGVTNIAEDTGNSIPGLRAIYFPETLQTITQSVFNDNPLLTRIKFGNNITIKTYDVFNNCPNIETIILPINANIKIPYFNVMFTKLKYIVYYGEDGSTTTHNLHRHYEKYYYETYRRQIGNVIILNLSNLNFYTKDPAPKSKTAIYLNNQSNKLFVGNNITIAISEYRKHNLMNELEKKTWEYKSIHNKNKDYNEYCNIIRQSIKNYIKSFYIKLPKDKINVINKHIKQIPTYVDYIKKFITKYKNIDNNIDELSELDIDQLLKKISPKKYANINKSCTHWLKKHPVTPEEMYTIIKMGFNNPGAFPYTWLKEIPIHNRGKITIKLHKLFKMATIKLYSPSTENSPNEYSTEILNKLSKQISDLIKQQINIEYLSSGNFSKAYLIYISGDKKYVWKVHHCDRPDSMFKTYYHNTETQNAFLMSGKKYNGKIKFGKILTAGISSQRGEIYLINTYTEGTPIKHPVNKVFERTYNYSLLDKNVNNILNNTIIDIGGVHINYDTWYQPKYVLKIKNAVLYQSWEAVEYVINNYSSKQIQTALDFINTKLLINRIEFNMVQERIKFLTDKTKNK